MRITELTILLLALAACGEDPIDPDVGDGTSGLVARVDVPPAYGLHDTFVRDGIALLCAWNTGVIILDVGDGRAGGTPEAPVEISRFAVTGGVGGRIHNAWWFHNPATGEARYLFLGQEGPGSLGATASGDLFAYDVQDLANPQLVATYHRDDNSGAHNFWVDEAAQVLFAAYYNGGVVALDISGTLPPGDLAIRELDVVRPGGADTYVWGVMLGPDGSLYASDMLSGLWQLRFVNGAFTVAAGGHNVPERFTSDLWIDGGYAYTGTWGFREEAGDVVRVWALNAAGAPAPAGTISLPDVGTVSDVEVSADGRVLLVSAELGEGEGLYLYDLTASRTEPPLLWHRAIEAGVHTTTFGAHDGRHYVYGAKNPGFTSGPALLIYDVTAVWP